MTEFKPSERVRVTKNVPMSVFTEELGVMIIFVPDNVINNAGVDNVIITATPSGSTADGSA